MSLLYEHNKIPCGNFWYKNYSLCISGDSEAGRLHIAYMWRHTRMMETVNGISETVKAIIRETQYKGALKDTLDGLLSDAMDVDKAICPKMPDTFEFKRFMQDVVDMKSDLSESRMRHSCMEARIRCLERDNAKLQASLDLCSEAQLQSDKTIVKLEADLEVAEEAAAEFFSQLTVAKDAAFVATPMTPLDVFNLKLQLQAARNRIEDDKAMINKYRVYIKQIISTTDTRKQ